MSVFSKGFLSSAAESMDLSTMERIAKKCIEIPNNPCMDFLPTWG